MKSLTLRILALAALLLISAGSIFAQDTKTESKSTAPTHQEGDFGVGVTLGSLGDAGVIGTYYINGEMQIGAKFGAYYQMGSESVEDEMYLTFAPFAKFYIMEPIRKFKPFAKGAFVVSTTSETYTNIYQQEETRTVTSTGLSFYLGADWEALSSVTVTTGISVLSFKFDPSVITIGVGEAFIGVIFFL
jgi:hypothetical protein